ncbi:MAG: RNA polymerase sigma factor [Polyangiaceae bacterium]
MSFFAENPDLLGAFRAGERRALEQVYRTHVRPIERYVYSLCRAAGAYELLQTSTLADLLQEIFIRAFSHNARQAYDGVRDYQHYLRAIARNCFVDALRARGREVLKAPEEFLLDPCEPEAEPDAHCDPRIVAVLQAYLGELTPGLDGVYRQRFVLGRSQDEASAALGLSRRQLRTAEQRLRVGLRRALLLAGLLRGEVRATLGQGAAAKAAMGG